MEKGRRLTLEPLARTDGKDQKGGDGLHVERHPERFSPEHRRVITRTFMPGGEERILRVLRRVLETDEKEVHRKLAQVMREFDHRHRRFHRTLERNYRAVCHFLPPEVVNSLSDERRLLIGACFTHEYSISAAAMFNPSIVPAPDQSGVPEGSARVIISFRATGEGHISSVEFREGIADRDGDIEFEPISPYLESPDIVPDHHYENRLFRRKLKEIGLAGPCIDRFFERLDEDFTYAELAAEMERERSLPVAERGPMEEELQTIGWLAESNYTVRFHDDIQISERVLFPVSDNERLGIEDARFVRFIDDDGSVLYVATYTAYNGVRILPQMIETSDFVTFKVSTLNGPAVQNKGMALFPRRIGGEYVMLGRQDGESNYIMTSDNLHFWNEKTLLNEPLYPWEFIQVGNNGSPIETPEGWLVITHGVGPMRKYCLGAMLLDLDDPRIVLGRTKRPFLCPNTEEREGYVPNVVYTCGVMQHYEKLIIPYAMSDSISGFATVKTSELLHELLENGS